MGVLGLVLSALMTAIGVSLVVIGINSRNASTAEGAAEVGLFRQAGQLGERTRAAARRPMTRRLVQAGLHRRESEFWAVSIASALIGALAGWFAVGLNPLTLVFAVGAGLIPYAVVRHLATARTSKIEKQLPGVMLSIADTLRASRSLPMAIDQVGRSAGPPLGEEFARASRRVMMGATVEESIAAIAERTRVRDLELLSTAISVVRVSGGDLPRMLNSMAAVARARRALAGQVRAMTAQARATSLVLSMLPVIVGVAGSLAVPTYFGVLTTTTAGWALLTVAAALLAMGQLFIRGIMARQTR
jgi:tight adherence protein B